ASSWCGTSRPPIWSPLQINAVRYTPDRWTGCKPRGVMKRALFLVLFIGFSAVAADKPTPQTHADVSAGQVDAADRAERFVVKVINLTANLFTPEVQGAHGTGFIVELPPERGVIFTNNHVVEKGLH